MAPLQVYDYICSGAITFIRRILFMYHVYDSKLILPLVVLILWRDASKETPLTIDQIYSKLLVYY